MPPTRRDCLRGAAALALPPAALGADPPPLAPLNRFPRMVHEWTVAQVRAAERDNLRALAALSTRADAERYVETVRAKIARCFGPLPAKTPLNPRVTGALERDGYIVEKVIFDSRPGFPVTANLYLPRGKGGRVPGVVGACGHSANGKAAEAYQSFAQGLARAGFAVILFDPVGQGERSEYDHFSAGGKPGVGAGVSEHLLAGNQQHLVGEFLGTWRAWDGVRALDYLLSRPEVDPARVGVTGNSGGGTDTAWLCGLDRRWAFAAPACFVTTFRRNLENELPADTEQCPPMVFAERLDHADFLAAMAPKPVAILAQERDFFDVRGAEEAFARLRRLYGLLGAAENVHLHVGGGEHGYSKENREAMYQWFRRHGGAPGDAAEPKLTVEKDSDLWCTPAGRVADLGAKTVFAFTKEKSEALAAARGAVRGDALRKAVADALKLPAERGPAPEFRVLRAVGNRRYPRPHATTYAVETEPGVFAVVSRVAEARHEGRPPRGDVPTILYVSHHSADAELRDEPLVRELMRDAPGAEFWAVDVRGVGESRPDTCGAGQFLLPYGSDYFYAAHGVMLGRPYPGQKVLDVLRVLDWLASFGRTRIHVAALGWGTIPATFAALFSPAVGRLTLKGAPPSYRALAESRRYEWPLSSFVPGALASFDLPDCYREVRAEPR